MESGKLKPNFRDIYYISTAKETNWQQAHRFEERKETTFTKSVVPQSDYEKKLAYVRERMGELADGQLLTTAKTTTNV